MIRDPYKKLSKYYDTFVEPANTVLRKILFKMYGPKQGMRVLEVGCGTGTNLCMYQKAGCEVTGIDLSPSMAQVARKKLGGSADIRVGDASQMPFSDGYFDIVIAMLTLHEMPGYIRSVVMNEMARVLKQNGRILLIDFRSGPIRFPRGWLYKSVILFFEIIAGKEHFKNYRDFLKNNGLPSLIEKNNLSFENEKIVSGGNLVLYSVKSD